MKLKISLIISVVLLAINAFAANYYWVGGSGSWSNFGAHWATTSGGSAFYTQVPQSTDNVFFDANSFSATGQTITVDQPVVQCADMTWSAQTKTPAFYSDYTNTLKIYGSLALTAGITFDFEGPISFEATTAGKTITTAGNTINTTVTFNGIAGSWTLQDALNTRWVFLNNGTLTTNNQTVNAYSFTSITSSPRTLNMGTSTFNLSFYGSIWEINATGMTMNAGASTIKGTATSGGSQDFYGAGFTYNDIFFVGTQSGKINGNSTIHDVSFAADGYIQGNCSFHNVTFSANAFLMSNSNYNSVTIAQDGDFSSSNVFNLLTLSLGHSYSLGSGLSQTINGSLVANGNCSSLIDIHSSAPGSVATIIKTAGTVSLAYVVLKDITATGGATFTATNTADLGNNTGWTISSLPSRNLYWIGNTGNWSDGNHWSLSSGGTPVGCSPTTKDNVFFDSHSFTQSGQTVTVDMNVSINNMNWTGASNSPTLYGDYSTSLKVAGSLTFVSGVNFNFSGALSFEATSGNNTITTNGVLIPTSISFNGVGGTWTLQDALNCSYWIYLNRGTLNTNNQTVNAYAFTSTSGGTRVLNAGSSIFNLSFNGYIWEINPTGVVVNAAAATINGVGTNGGEQDFYGGGFTYNNIYFIGNALGKVLDNNTINDVTFSSDGFIQGGSFHDVTFSGNAVLYNNNTCNNVKIGRNGDFYDNNTFNQLTLTPGFSYTLANGTTQSVSSLLQATGSCGALIDIRSSTSGSKANIVKTSGSVNVSYVTLKDINVGGGAAFAANNAIDLSNNSGWATIVPLVSKNLYWVGNGGLWSDGNHWSLSSGGAPAGCAPTPIDNVFFDSHSFSLANQSVTLDAPTAVANNVTWTGVTNTPTLSGDYVAAFKVYGSLTLSPNMVTNFVGPFIFASTNLGNTITTAGNIINTSITFDGIGGSWTLQDALNCNYWVYLNNGTLNTNNKTLNLYAFNSTTAATRTLNMGSSVFNLSFNGLIWNVNATGLTVNAGTSIINGTGANGGEQDFYGGGFTYNNIAFVNNSLGKIIDNNTINDLVFSTDGFIQGGTFHDVTFNGNAVLYYNNICNNITIAKDADILGSNTFNFLKLSPGYTYTFSAGETQTVLSGGNICATGTGSLPIRIQSSSVGSPSYITKTSGIMCWDYVRVSDMSMSGGAMFNAGLAPTNSQDMGGNSGFVYTGGCNAPSCSPCIATNLSAQPLPLSVCNGLGASFSVSATGTGLTYQWQINQGAGFVNLTNVAPYSGVTTSTLAVATTTSLLNGAQYRCVVASTCSPVVNSNAAILTVNPLPVVTTSVSSTTVTITATGGTAPYVGTGVLTNVASGTYTYTVTDAKGCSASASATVISNVDNVPPTAICKTATITLVSGSAALAASAVNNGSYDNVGIASITVSPSTFTCANLGANTVTLTVKDLSGNTSTCQTTVTVLSSTPVVLVTAPASNVSACVGSNASFAITATGTGLSYQWQVNQGSGFVNLTNGSPYSGVSTNNLVVTAVTGALNNYQYRCVINGTCSAPVTSAAGTLTVNPLPIATSTVSGSVVTVAATSGTAPYLGVGTFSGLAAGTYTYTVTDAKGCSTSTSATVTVTSVDNTPPTAICKTATITLVNGVATLVSSAVNNGSYDNVGVTSVTVSPSTFTCANIGVNTVILTVKDAKGNAATCQTTVTVVGTMPTVTVSQTGLSGFSQGSGLVLNAVASSGVSYLWNTGETTASKNASSSGTNSVTVTNTYGCKATATTSVGGGATNSLSSFTIIVQDEAELKNYSTVQSGGVGATLANGEVELENHSSIVGATAFAQAKYISVNNYCTVQTKIYNPAVVNLPTYKTNTYCSNNYGNCHHSCSYGSNGNFNNNNGGGCSNSGNNSNNYGACSHHCDGTSVNCSHSSKNKNCNNNSTLNMTDSIYGNVTIGDYTTVTFTKPVVYLKNFMVGAHSTIVFTGCTELKICGEVNLGDYTVFNADAKMVVMYADGNVHVGKGDSFTGVIYSKGNLITSGTSSTGVTMKGMFIANRVESNYTAWNWNTSYTNCSSTRMLTLEQDNGITSSGDDMGIDAHVYPNPSLDNFNLEIFGANGSFATIVVYDVTGRKVFTKDDVETNATFTFGTDLKAGIYLLNITAVDGKTKTVRVIKQNN